MRWFHNLHGIIHEHQWKDFLRLLQMSDRDEMERKLSGNEGIGMKVVLRFQSIKECSYPQENRKGCHESLFYVKFLSVIRAKNIEFLSVKLKMSFLCSLFSRSWFPSAFACRQILLSKLLNDNSPFKGKERKTRATRICIFQEGCKRRQPATRASKSNDLMMMVRR